MKTLGEIADFLDGELRGDPSISIERVVHPALAKGPGDLVLILSPNALSFLSSGKIANTLVPTGMGAVGAPNQIAVRRPLVALARLLQIFERPVYVPPGVHSSAVIDPTATIGDGAAIGPHCWVGPRSTVGRGSRLVCNVSVGADVTLGENCLLHAGVCIGDRTEIGNRVIIQPNATIGGDGFAFVTPEPGSVESVRETGEVRKFNVEILRINSIGNVVIEDEVEIGCGTCIDRGTLHETRIGRGTKLDNLVQVGHNVTIGQNCLIVSQVGLGGSSKVGNRAVVGGQSGLPDHVVVGDDAVVHARSGITGHVPDRAAMMGIPALPLREFMEREVKMRRLPNLIKDLKQQMESIVEKLNSLLPPK